jgi:hypothetical protein
MYSLLDDDPQVIEQAILNMASSDDQQFIPVLMEWLWANQIGLVRNSYSLTVEALNRLSGEQLGEPWPNWVEWYGQTDLEPPLGFTGWKGQLLSTIDPGFGQFLKDELPSRIRVEEIQWGGVTVDGIPALDNPKMISADQAAYLDPDEAVFGLSINGDARAYPLRIMDWHEMANDIVGDVPVSLAYCTLCGAAVAYDGRGSDGRTYTFGSSGFLFRSNKLMYDRQTRTLWNQLTGEPILGSVANKDLTLEILPVVLTTWTEWQSRHPETLVLDLDTGYERVYEPGAAYGDYFSAEDTMFPVWQRSDLLPQKDRVFTLRIDGIPKAYPLAILAEDQVVNDMIGETAVVLVALNGVLDVEGNNLRVGAVKYEAGGEVRAYKRGDYQFEVGPNDDSLLDQEGLEWRVSEDALISPDGQILPRLGGHLAYWFGWYAFFPQTLLYDR